MPECRVCGTEDSVLRDKKCALCYAASRYSVEEFEKAKLRTEGIHDGR